MGIRRKGRSPASISRKDAKRNRRGVPIGSIFTPVSNTKEPASSDDPIEDGAEHLRGYEGEDRSYDRVFEVREALDVPDPACGDHRQSQGADRTPPRPATIRSIPRPVAKNALAASARSTLSPSHAAPHRPMRRQSRSADRSSSQRASPPAQRGRQQADDLVSCAQQRLSAAKRGC